MNPAMNLSKGQRGGILVKLMPRVVVEFFERITGVYALREQNQKLHVSVERLKTQAEGLSATLQHSDPEIEKNINKLYRRRAGDRTIIGITSREPGSDTS